MPGRAAAPAGPELGNLEANVRFLDESGLLRPGSRVLEIGSGRGSLLQELRARELDAAGVETSAERIAEALERFGSLPLELVGSVVVPYPDASFDLVVSFDVFEHIPDSDSHLAEVRRVLRPGGWYLLQTPNKWSNTIFETIRWRSFTRWRADHCSLHTASQLERRLRRHGFEPALADVRVVTPFFREKVRRHLGWPGLALLALANPDRLPRRMRTNLYVRAQKQ
jgi:cyclopropane fatty-acyl-phospholipid synthase-like methyltransferase